MVSISLPPARSLAKIGEPASLVDRPGFIGGRVRIGDEETLPISSCTGFAGPRDQEGGGVPVGIVDATAPREHEAIVGFFRPADVQGVRSPALGEGDYAQGFTGRAYQAPERMWRPGHGPQPFVGGDQRAREVGGDLVDMTTSQGNDRPGIKPLLTFPDDALMALQGLNVPVSPDPTTDRTEPGALSPDKGSPALLAPSSGNPQASPATLLPDPGLVTDIVTRYHRSAL